MSSKVKDKDVKNCTYYLFNSIISIKNFDPNNIRIDEKSYKNILIYYIGYVKIKDLKYIKIYSVNSLCFILKKVNGYFEEINGSKSLALVPTSEGEKKFKRYEELWIKIKCGLKFN